MHQVLIHAINRNEAGCTVEVLPYISEAFDASKEIPETVVCPSLPFTYLSDLVWTDKAPDVVPEVHQAMRLLFPIPPVMFGLPNITGSARIHSGRTVDHSGALIQVRHGTNAGDNGGWTNDYGIDIDASMSNSIYGVASTVQPQSLCLFACVKI